MERKESKSAIFVFSHPQTGSGILKEMLEKHPQLYIFYHSFQEAYTLGLEKLERRDHSDAYYSTDRRRASGDETYQKAFDRLDGSMTRAKKEGKRPLFIEDAYMIFRPDVISANIDHDTSLATVPTPVIMTSKIMKTNWRCPLRASNLAHSSDSPFFTATFPIFHPITEGLGIHTIESRSPNANPTVLPDVFLRSVTPICLFRHPARTFPSLYRAAHLDVHGSEFRTDASLRWCKLLVEWYTITTGAKPIVLDSDDLLHEPTTITKVCRALSLDESGVHTSWNTMPQPEIREQDAMKPAMNATIQTSNGLEQSMTRDNEIDIDEEAKGWGEEFGVDVAETIKGFVIGAMDDYYSLRQCAMK